MSTVIFASVTSYHNEKLTKSIRLFSENVAILTSGEVQFRIVESDRKIEPLKRIQTVSDGVIDATFGHTHLLSKNHPAAVLFGSPPISKSIVFDNTTFFSWLNSAGGLKLYDEMWKEMDLNIKGFILQTSGPHALGWFKEPILSLESFKEKRFRDSPGFSFDIHKAIGLSIVPLKPADIIPELQKRNLDAASWCCAKSDLALGLYKSMSNYYLQGISKNVLNTDLYLNETLYNSLSIQQQKAIEIAASALSLIHI